MKIFTAILLCFFVTSCSPTKHVLVAIGEGSKNIKQTDPMEGWDRKTVYSNNGKPTGYSR